MVGYNSYKQYGAAFTKSPRYSFGARTQDLRSKDMRSRPAPNQYSIPSTINTKRGPIMGARLRGHKRASTPGPGNYNMHNSYLSLADSTPGYSMGRRLSRPNKNQSLPGPGSYSLKSYRNVMCENRPQYTMRPRTATRLRGGMRDTPGAKYEIPSTIGSGLKKTMSSRSFRPLRKSASTPAPNAYSPNKLVCMSQKPSFSMRARTPGPKPGYASNPGPKYMIASQFS